MPSSASIAVFFIKFWSVWFQELAKDSHKYRSKKERKEQKSSFRDILKTIEDDEEFYEKMAFSKRETLEITSWAMKKQYDQMCKVIFILLQFIFQFNVWIVNF